MNDIFFGATSHIRTVIVIRSYGSFILPFTPKTGFI